MGPSAKAEKTSARRRSGPFRLIASKEENPDTGSSAGCSRAVLARDLLPGPVPGMIMIKRPDQHEAESVCTRRCWRSAGKALPLCRSRRVGIEYFAEAWGPAVVQIGQAHALTAARPNPRMRRRRHHDRNAESHVGGPRSSCRVLGGPSDISPQEHRGTEDQHAIKAPPRPREDHFAQRM